MLQDIAAPFVLAVSVTIVTPTFSPDRYIAKQYEYEFPALSALDARKIIEQFDEELAPPLLSKVRGHLYRIDPVTRTRTEVALDRDPEPPAKIDLKMEWAKP